MRTNVEEDQKVRELLYTVTVGYGIKIPQY